MGGAGNLDMRKSNNKGSLDLSPAMEALERGLAQVSTSVVQTVQVPPFRERLLHLDQLNVTATRTGGRPDTRVDHLGRHRLGRDADGGSCAA